MSTTSHPAASATTLSRWAGVLYLGIFILGIWSEAFVRQALIVPADAAATAQSIIGSNGLFLLSFAADSLMVVFDVALAILLLILFRPAGRVLALSAAAFRLIQSAVLGANLILLFAGTLLVYCTEPLLGFTMDQTYALALFFIEMHGYDLGLIFFGVSCILLGSLFIRSGFAPRILGVLAIASGVVYLVGSYAAFLAPDIAETVAYLYVVPVISELAIALWLLLRGVNADRWAQATAAMPQSA